MVPRRVGIQKLKENTRARHTIPTQHRCLEALDTHFGLGERLDAGRADTAREGGADRSLTGIGVASHRQRRFPGRVKAEKVAARNRSALRPSPSRRQHYNSEESHLCDVLSVCPAKWCSSDDATMTHQIP